MNIAFTPVGSWTSSVYCVQSKFVTFGNANV